MTKKKKQGFLNAVKKLVDFKLECGIDKERFPEFFNNCGYEEGDEEAPFFSEACLYNLVGKEDARTILALIRNVLCAAGLEDNDFWDIF